MIDQSITTYNSQLTGEFREICEQLMQDIEENLPGSENKVWHGHPVWFIEGNPIVGYSKLKESVQLLFWSGQSFDEPNLEAEGNFKAAQKRFTSADEIEREDLLSWLKKAKDIQWDYKNIVKRKGVLERIS